MPISADRVGVVQESAVQREHMAHYTCVVRMCACEHVNTQVRMCAHVNTWRTTHITCMALGFQPTWPSVSQCNLRKINNSSQLLFVFKM